MTDVLTVILAAGQGTRMKSEHNKVLHQVGGKMMIQHVIDNLRGLNPRIVVVTGYQAEEVEGALEGEGLEFVLQEEQLGTGHAVIQAGEQIKRHQGPVVILYGDIPLLRRESLEKLIEVCKEEKAGAAVLTACLEDPAGYGRIVRDQNNMITKIVEDRDATPEEKDIKEINSGVYCFREGLLIDALMSLDNDNAQGEYYLTDVFAYLQAEGERIVPVVVADKEEISGINDRVNLARAEKVIRKRINETHMQNGVTIVDPETTYIDSGVVIGRDTVVYPFTFLEGKTEIGAQSIIGPRCRIVDSKIGNNVNLKDSSIILESEVAGDTNIGPFAHIRPGTIISRGARVGDFVELKKAVVGKKSKVPHLSYVGDAVIGEGTNIGAGTIFANYDGKNKHQTIVGDGVFIGSNTTLVAPLKVGDGAKTGAGAVVTRDVPGGETVIGVPARVIKKKKGGREGN